MLFVSRNNILAWMKADENRRIIKNSLLDLKNGQKIHFYSQKQQEKFTKKGIFHDFNVFPFDSNLDRRNSLSIILSF